MSLITLKPLDDGQKPIEIPKGKTVIGRGPLLGCSDKKVSRNHAVLEVTNKDEVFLTPTHVNPCFYQPTADSPGTILKKDVPCKLENGDSFSLLPRAYRYQLNIGNLSSEKGSKEGEGKTNGSTVDHSQDGISNTNEEFGDTIVSEKAFFKEEVSNPEKNCAKEENTFSKKIAEIKGSNENISVKNSDDSGSAEMAQKETTRDSEENQVVPSGPPTLEEEEDALEVNNDESESSDKLVTDGPSHKEDDASKEEPEESEVAVPDEASLESQPLAASSNDPHSDEEEEEALAEESNKPAPKATAKKQPKEVKQRQGKRKAPAKSESSPKPKGRKRTAKAKQLDDGEEGTSRQPGRTSSRTNRQTRQGLSLEDFVVSDDDEWASDRSEPKRVGRKRKKQKRGDESGSDWEVDHKKPKKALLQKALSGSESGGEMSAQKNKKGPRGRRKNVKSSDEVNETFSDEDEPQPSSSGEVKQRMPCSFGKKCFRRNASHKEQFSHPGDSDYTSSRKGDDISESEGEEESAAPKKECPYGANCFRKNPQHKKDFKHTKTVRPQREAAKQADQKSKSGRNSDDYDINDSFLNDDSADEYKPVDSGSDYESGEQKTKKLAKGRIRAKGKL